MTRAESAPLIRDSGIRTQLAENLIEIDRLEAQANAAVNQLILDAVVEVLAAAAPLTREQATDIMDRTYRETYMAARGLVHQVYACDRAEQQCAALLADGGLLQ